MKKTTIVLGVVLATLLATVVWAAVPPNKDQGPRWMAGGMWVMPPSQAANTTTANKVTRMLAFSSTIDFASATITCRDSSAISVPGAQVGDPCFVGMPATLTAGGTGLHESFTCYVSAADNVKVRACAAGTADDPASVTFRGQVISTQ
jgi:hypothetical protein